MYMNINEFKLFLIRDIWENSLYSSSDKAKLKLLHLYASDFQSVPLCSLYTTISYDLLHPTKCDNTCLLK